MRQGATDVATLPLLVKRTKSGSREVVDIDGREFRTEDNLDDLTTRQFDWRGEEILVSRALLTTPKISDGCLDGGDTMRRDQDGLAFVLTDDSP